MPYSSPQQRPSCVISCLQKINHPSMVLDPELASHYPSMKLGLLSAVAFYADKLLTLAQSHIEANPQVRHWVITAPPYSTIPAAANLICWQIYEQLKPALGEKLTLVDLRLPKKNMAIKDANEFKSNFEYSANTIEQRVKERTRLQQGSDDIIDYPDKFSQRGVIVVNDICVTGTQQKFMQHSFDQVGVTNLQWLYIFAIEQQTGKTHPQIEHQINNSKIQTPAQFQAIICADDIHYTARCISRLFSHETQQFESLLGQLSTPKQALIFDLACKEGRFDGAFFAAKLQLLKTICQSHANHQTTQKVCFDSDYKVPFIERSLINGPHYQIPVDCNHPLFNDPLVNLKDYPIAFESYHAVSDGSNPPYFKAIKGSRQEGWLRKTYVEKLVKVNENLRPYGAELLILDAYRSIECQRGLWTFFYERARQEIANASEQDCRDYALGFVRDPRHYDTLDARTFPIHITGSSVDVTLRDIKTGKLRNMGSKFEEIIDVSKTDYFEHQLAKGLIAEDDPRLLNRRLLGWAFTQEGFLNDPILYWHYDWGNQIWIKVKKALHGTTTQKAWYGHIDNPQWGIEDASLMPPVPAQNDYL
jgi:D-alanyl-D-alanine dipeptidase